MAACTFKVFQALFKPVPWSLAMRCAYGLTLRLRMGRTSLKVSGGPGGEALLLLLLLLLLHVWVFGLKVWQEEFRIKGLRLGRVCWMKG